MAGRATETAEQKLSLNDFYVIFSGMRGVRREAIEAIYRAGYDTVEKVRRATVEELVKIKGVGERVAEKVIARAKEYGGGRLEDILLTIPRLRRDVIGEILKRYPTRESLQGATIEDLMEIRGVGRSLAQKILEAVEAEGAPEEAALPVSEELPFEEFSELFRGIPGVSGQMLRTLYDNGFNTVEKIARAPVEGLSRFRGIGEKTALRLITRAEDIMKASGVERGPKLEEILLSIPRLRKDVVERILQRYPDLESIKGASTKELMEIEGVGRSLAARIVEAVRGYPAPVPEERAPEPVPEEEKEVAAGEMGEEKIVEGGEKGEEKPKGPGAVSAIISNIKGIFGKIRGIIFPDKSRVREKVVETPKKEEEESAGEVEEKRKPQSLEEIEGLSEEIIKKLKESGYRDIEELKEATVEDLIMIEGIDEELARKILSSI